MRHRVVSSPSLANCAWVSRDAKAFFALAGIVFGHVQAGEEDTGTSRPRSGVNERAPGMRGGHSEEVPCPHKLVQPDTESAGRRDNA